VAQLLRAVCSLGFVPSQQLEATFTLNELKALYFNKFKGEISFHFIQRSLMAAVAAADGVS